MLRRPLRLSGLGFLCALPSHFQSRQKRDTPLALTLPITEQTRDKLSPVPVPPPLQPQGLTVEPRPFLLRLNLFNIDVQVGPDQGAPLGEAVLIVRLRQSVRLYKFFIKP